MGIKALFGLEGKIDDAGKGYIPSPLMLFLAVDSKTNYKPIAFPKKYKGSKKVLMVCTEERYMTMANGKLFSTGNHPVESAQPIMQLVNAGFEYEVATPTGKPACIEMWALPKKDEVFLKFFNESFKPKIDNPKSLKDIMADSAFLEDIVCVFAPGGQGAMLGLPDNDNFGALIKYIKDTDRYLMSVCHGPASFLAAKDEPHPYSGYKIACFPDSIDKFSPNLGYMPGHQTWYFGEKLIEKGITIVNKGADDTFVADRKLLTGASPKACQELGKVAAEKLLEEYA